MMTRLLRLLFFTRILLILLHELKLLHPLYFNRIISLLLKVMNHMSFPLMLIILLLTIKLISNDPSPAFLVLLCNFAWLAALILTQGWWNWFVSSILTTKETSVRLFNLGKFVWGLIDQESLILVKWIWSFTSWRFLTF